MAIGINLGDDDYTEPNIEYVDKMRGLILKRLQEIKKQSDNFPKTSMRWKNLGVYYNVHISEVDFNQMDNEKLLQTFEAVTRRFNAQM